MKRFLILLCLSAVLLSLTSCGGKPEASMLCDDCGAKNVASASFCSSCGQSMSDYAPNQPSAEKEEAPAVKPESSEGTAETENKETVPSDPAPSESAPAHTHSFVATDCTSPAKCSCGATEASAAGHTWKAASCTAPKTCSRCGATEGGTLDHSWRAATCAAPKTCSGCGMTEGGTLDHSWKAATCSAPQTCSGCGATSGSALGHTWKDATCTSAKICSTCGGTSGSALGHTYSQGACTRCGAIDANYVVPTLVYQDSKVKIYYKQMASNGLVFEVENMTGATITIQADALALNGLSTENIIMSDDVAPYSIGEVIAKCHVPVTGAVGTISGQLRVIDFNRSFQSYDALFANVTVNSNVAVPTPAVPNALLYSDSRVQIYYKEMNSSGVTFTVKNLTGVTITIQADSVSVNKRSTNNIIMSDDVAPYSVGDVVAKCSFGSVPAVVETVGGTLRVIDFNKSFRTYDATFVNVPV